MGASYLDPDRLKRSIAAVATAPGAGAIGIVRISGADAIELGAGVFSRPRVLLEAESHTLHVGKVVGRDRRGVDDVLAAVMRAPHSYTGENVLEFQAHGGNVQAAAVLQAVLEHGALPALPGEFTFRAFANGRIDLTQAESVADIIGAGTRLSARVALQNADGMLRRSLDGIREDLVGLRARFEASIDFVDDDIPELEAPLVLRELDGIAGRIDSLLQTYAVGRVLRSGARVVLSGPPNVGKSSLFNALLNYDRAIVTEIPGTTRDALTETLDIDGLPVILADTAGLRESTDLIEIEGIRRSRDYRAAADLILEVGAVDCPAASVQPIADASADVPLLRILNKIDLLGSSEEQREAAAHPEVIALSARTGAGLEHLRERIHAILIGEQWNEDTPTVTRQRHSDGLARCGRALRRAIDFVQDNIPLEVTAIELRAACDALEELTGKICDDEVLARIFGEFCVGK